MADAKARVLTLLRHIRDLPSLPDVAMRAMQATEDKGGNMRELAAIISRDQAMTARVLRLANSTDYGIGRSISTVSDAVVRLGTKALRNMAMAASCQEQLLGELTGYRMAQGSLWRHSYCTALIAHALSVRVRYRASEEAFVAGLLHDIGKVLMNMQMGTEFGVIRNAAIRLQIPFVEAEQQVLGFDHAEVGALMLKKWNLPASLEHAVRHHHSPLTAKQPTALCCLVHLADTATLMLGVGLGGDGLIYAFDHRVLDLLKLTEADVERAICEVSEVAATELRL